MEFMSNVENNVMRSNTYPVYGGEGGGPSLKWMCENLFVRFICLGRTLRRGESSVSGLQDQCFK